MRIITGNLLSIKRGVIVHQVNNCGLMNAGIAKQIREAYPSHYNDYMRMYSAYMTQYGRPDLDKYYGHAAIAELLGQCVITQINPGFYIAGIFAQHGCGRELGVRYTDYSAMSAAFDKIHAQFSRWDVYIPAGIGSSLAGGDRSTIHHIIARHLPNATLIERGMVL